MVVVPTVKLNNGRDMPVLGLGTSLASGNIGCNAVKIAIDNGYRLFDTAYFYQNEKDVGRAINEKIADGTVTRDELFVTTKLWSAFHAPQNVEKCCMKSLKNLGLDYVDLYLMHSPMGLELTDPEELLPKNADGTFKFSDVDYLDTWKAMESLVDKGLAKSIGVSNFNSEQITRILENCRIKPVTNQVECNPTFNQKKLIKFCKDRDITVTSFRPLGRPSAWFEDKSLPKPSFMEEKVIDIAKKHNKTPAQVVLRFLHQFGVILIPKSANEARIKENLGIFDFELTADEVSVIESLQTGQRGAYFEAFDKHKYYSFNAEF